MARPSASFLAKGTFVSGTGAVSPGIPAGMVAGDFMVLEVVSVNQTIATPTGWTPLPAHSGTAERGTAGAAGGVQVRLFYRWWQSGDGAPSVADTGNLTCAQIWGFRNVHDTDPFGGVTPVGYNAAASTTLTMSGLTTLYDAMLVVHAVGLDRDAASTNTVTGSPTNANLSSPAELHDQIVSTATGGGIYACHGLRDVAGATGNTTATQSSSAYAGITFALRSRADDLYLDTTTPAQASAVGTTTSLTATTASFTAPTDAILVAKVQGNNGTEADTVSWSVSDTGGLTWNLIIDRDYSDGGQAGAVAAYWARTTSATSRTVSAQATASIGVIDDVVLDLEVWIGADLDDPIGASGGGSSTTNGITPAALASEADNSVLHAVAGDWNGNGAPTSSDLVARAFDRAGYWSGLSGYKLLGAAGAQTFNFDAAGAGATATNWIAFELKPPAAGGASVRVGGAWKDVSQISVRVGGAWKTVASAHVRVGGAWEQVH